MFCFLLRKLEISAVMNVLMEQLAEEMYVKERVVWDLDDCKDRKGMPRIFNTVEKEEYIYGISNTEDVGRKYLGC